MNLPIRGRLTLWYVGLLAVILVVVGAFLILRLQAGLLAGVDQNLNDHANEIAIDLQGGNRSFESLSNSSLRALSRGAFAAQLESRDGRVLQSTDDPTGRVPMINTATRAAVLSSGPVHLTTRLGPERARFRVVALPYPHNGATNVLVVARSLVDVDESVRRLRLLLILAVPVAVAGAGAGGWLLARKALLPVDRMTRKAEVITADRLQERVAVPRSRDELGRLAETLNDMLNRIERGVQEQQRLVADASHELRTPLAVMRSEIDVCLRAPDLPEDDAREVLSSVGEEVERMSRILDNLLTLARIDEGRLDLLCAPQRLDTMVGEVLDKLRPIAHAKGIGLVAEGEPAEVLADGPRFELVITNLVDNAIKYTGAGGTVRVVVWRDPHEAGISVHDTGPGIGADALPHLFDRFYRADSARSRADGGSGLGLSICKEIITAHGGRLWASSELGHGSSFTLAMPLESDSAPVARAGG
jgi:two-component system, OmpR family, sensor kinase